MALKLSNEFISETARADIQALNKFEDTVIRMMPDMSYIYIFFLQQGQ